VSIFACELCRQGPPAISTFRINAKGQPGVWRCEKHINAGALAGSSFVDEGTKTIVHDLEDAMREIAKKKRYGL
jgi:hypothetical protein